LFRADFRTAGHASILRPRPYRHSEFVRNPSGKDDFITSFRPCSPTLSIF
jgi:hypothetical protein